MLIDTVLEADGVRLEAWEAGDPAAPSILLLHGVSRRRQTFTPLLPWLVPRFRVRAYDHRGHGGSGRLAPYRVVDYAADCRRVLPRSGSVVLYGHSLGALVALATAAAAPERVAGIVLEDPPGPSFLAAVARGPYAAIFSLYRAHASSPLAVGDLARVLAAAPLPAGPGMPATTFGATRDPASVRFTASCLKCLDPATMKPLLDGDWLDGLGWESLLGTVACPTLLLRADPARGGMLPDGDAAAIRDMIRDVTTIDLPGVGHNAVGQQPDIVPRFLLPFLETLSFGGPTAGA